MSRPLVSVIVPAYNHADFICACIESVLDQSFKDYELIVVNDGCTDRTAERLETYRHSGSIRYTEQSNSGVASARNRGLSLARGAYIAFLDDDDLWPEDKLKWQVSLLEAHPEAVMVAGKCLGIGSPLPEEGAPSASFLVDREQLREFCHFESPGQTLIRAEALREIGGFDTPLWGADDWDCYIRLSELGAIIRSDHPSLLYREHSDNASADYWRLYTNSLKVYRKHRALSPGTVVPYLVGTMPLVSWFLRRSRTAWGRDHRLTDGVRLSCLAAGEFLVVLTGKASDPRRQDTTER